MERGPSGEEKTGALHDWLSLLDFARPAMNAESAWLRMGAFVAGCVAIVYVLRGNLGILDARPLPNLTPDEHVGMRYGIPDETRHQIFEELAQAEKAERARAIANNTWNGHAWSREDDRGHQELTLARVLAGKHHVSLSAIYAVLEEGIREHWTDADGATLPATTPPQDPRSTW
jgi:hypothetical protein